MGCENFIAMKDMFDDQLLLRQVKRATLRDNEDDSEDGDRDVPRGTQRNKPQDVGDESTFMDVDDEERRMSVKEERMSRGPTLTQVSTDGEDEDEEDEDE